MFCENILATIKTRLKKCDEATEKARYVVFCRNERKRLETNTNADFKPFKLSMRLDSNQRPPRP